MKYPSRVIVVLSALVCLPTARAETYSGSLFYTPPLGPTDGIVVGEPGGAWAANNAAISWTVTNEDGSYPGYGWRYQYQVTQDSGKAGFSHLILETSGGFALSDLAGLTGATILSLGTQTTGSGNPGMPADLYGIRLAPIDSPGNWTFSFFSDRAPVWGDFYAKGGNTPTGVPETVYANYAYNRGFTIADVDPLDLPQNGSVDFHVLRPDSRVPEPAAVVNLVGLLVVALGGYLATRWRRNRSGLA